MKKLLQSLIVALVATLTPSFAQFLLEAGGGFYTGWGVNLGMGFERIADSPMGLRLGIHGAVAHWEI